ncbi:MAG: GSCFA domain-containing protein [Bacteroidales bacterium]|nr:GSCFA domain-containing protein [Bacteroidales bacterium]
MANCHKIPSEKFNRYLLKVDDIVNLYKPLINSLKEKYNDLEIIFTVSPIRHWKDGAVMNQVSKSTLVLAVHELVSQFDHVGYFPAYEIFMDELRDYRFYGADMLHPSDFAIDYIWSVFSDTYIDKEAMPMMDEIEKIHGQNP